MTTDRRTGTRGLVRITGATTVAGVVLVAVAALVSGSSAAYGALVGSAIAVGVFGFGAFTVDVVARVMPVASLMVALLTYVVQVLLLALIFAAITGSGLLDDTLDRNWLGGAIVLGAVVWMGVQLRLATTARIPAYETPSTTVPGPRPAGAEGGAR